MILNNKQVEDWTYNTALTNAEVRLIPLCGENSPVTVAQGNGIVLLSFGVFCDATCTLELQGDYQASFATVDTIFSLAILASVYTTMYDLPAPLGQNGYLPVSRPYVRWQLTDTSAGAATLTRFYARGE